jgi:peptidoglycan/xylan/chitin deacetylase (PgdA/CDA1 family)
MTKLLKTIGQSLYPYGIFRAGREYSSFSHSPLVYLTFDDGPIPEVTPKVLDILAKYNIKATFFMVGENIDKYPGIFAQVVQDGHSVGNHTYNHLKGWNTPFDQYMANVHQWEDTVRKNLSTIPNPQSPITKLFRPPYGKASFLQRRALHRLGYRIIYWDVLTRDYDASVTPEHMLEKIKRQVRPRSIINFHDSLKSNERMLAVLPQAIEWLSQQGYSFAAITA